MVASAPSFISGGKRRIAIPFSSAIAASVGLTLVSGRIGFPFRIVEVEIVFRDDTANLMQIWVLTSSNTSISVMTPPPDNNVFSPFSPSGFFLGEALVKRLSINYMPLEGDDIIKVHAQNVCTWPQTVNVSVTIEEA